MLLQCVDSFGSIQWQKYFYGGTSLLPPDASYRRGANARGISVWAAATPEDTRIAICGENSDDVLPLSQAPQGWVQQPPTKPQPDWTGFTAVYNGNRILLWTHHFFGDPPVLDTNMPDCAITDVSIRIETVGQTKRDVVTYCGISSHGKPQATNVPLSPHLPFLPNGPAGCATTAGGDSHNGTYQWDGIVGRLSRDHDAYATRTTTREFHSIVGGPEDDGLFGIDEFEGQRFVTAGSASRLNPGGSAPDFPFTTICGPTVQFRVGTVLTFDATQTRQSVPGALVLELAAPLGTIGSHPGGGLINSVARDVVVNLGHIVGTFTYDMYHIVGATDDPNFFGSVGYGPGYQLNTLMGASDGFILSSIDGLGVTGIGALSGGFVGGTGADGLTGVRSWNEYANQVEACGYSQTGSNVDIQVASFLANQALQNPMPSSPDPFLQLRRALIGGSGEDRPTVMGLANANSNILGRSGGSAFLTGLELSASLAPDDVGNPAGGGIATDPRARLTVVGRTRSTNYPTTALPFQTLYGAPRSFFGNDDAVRSEFDMLPEGVGRMDGTGSYFGPLPAPLPPSGTTGATTPTGALSAFGRRVGEPAPQMQRMLIDFEGINAAGQLPAVVVTRPPIAAWVLGTVLQFGFPASSPVVLGNVEYWLLDSSAYMWIDPWFSAQASWRFQFGIPLPAGPWSISAQLFCLITCDPLTWSASPCSLDPTFNTDMTIVGSPALFFEF